MKTRQKLSQIGLLTLLAAPMLLSACITQYSADHEAFLRKKECASYQDEMAARAEALNQGDGVLHWFGGVTFYSPALNTCVAIKGYTALQDLPSNVASDYETEFMDIFSDTTIQKFSSDDYTKEDGTNDLTAFGNAVNDFKKQLGLSNDL